MTGQLWFGSSSSGFMHTASPFTMSGLRSTLIVIPLQSQSLDPSLHMCTLILLREQEYITGIYVNQHGN